MSQLRVIVTGAEGLLGRHARARMHARNCAEEYSGRPRPFTIVPFDRANFSDTALLAEELARADVVFHFAGVNRAAEDDLIKENAQITTRLIEAASSKVEGKPHVLFSNSTHAQFDTAYGRSKRECGASLAESFDRFTDIVVPHVFGEGARPNYNNVTATLIDNLHKGVASEINPEGAVALAHAGDVAETFISSALNRHFKPVRCNAHHVKIPELMDKLEEFHSLYSEGVLPAHQNAFEANLFNCYRFAGFPDGWPRQLTVNSDMRGRLFETVRTLGGGQSFVSTSPPGAVRGNHFHLRKTERFVVLAGEARIEVRNILDKKIHSFDVSGENPVYIDMPTMHTHNITNTGSSDLVTMFWANEFFRPDEPDTYAEQVNS